MKQIQSRQPSAVPPGVYHCVSWIINRDLVLREPEKDQFAEYLRLYEQLLGVEVITYCVMGNHFHLLVEVPPRPKQMPSDEALVALIKKTKGAEEGRELAARLKLLRKQGHTREAEAERNRYLNLMWNLANFLKVLKQRMSQWFNGSRPTRRKGTLWEERYSVASVPDGQALLETAGFIDLNPVRTGLVDRPQDYRWSGFGEASAGKSPAKAGLQRIRDGMKLRADPKERDLAWYRKMLEEFSGRDPVVPAKTRTRHPAAPKKRA